MIPCERGEAASEACQLTALIPALRCREQRSVPLFVGAARPFIFRLPLGFEARDVCGFELSHDAVEPAGLELHATWTCGTN